MQTLTLDKLHPPVLLVWGLPEENIKAINLYETLMSMLSKHNLPSGEWQLIGKLSELTEEIIATFVEGNPASDTFCMSLEAEGHHIANPYGLNPCEHYGNMPTSCFTSCQGKCWSEADFDLDEWESAQSKTLPANTLIFKKV